MVSASMTRIWSSGRVRSFLLATALMSLLVVAACGGPEPAPTATPPPPSPTQVVVQAPTGTPTPPPTPTPTQTSTPVPTDTPTPPPTPTPTGTQVPTQAPTFTATAVPEPAVESDPKAKALIESAAERFSNVSSVKFELTVENGAIDLGSGIVVNNLVGLVAHPDRAHLMSTVRMDQAIVELELIKIGTDLYLLNPFSEQWQLLPPGSSNLELLDQFAAAEVFRRASDLTYVGQETIGGVEAHQLRATLTPEALVPLIGTVVGDKPIVSDIWIDVDEELPRQILLTIESAAGDPLLAKISLSEFDAPVTIDRP